MDQTLLQNALSVLFFVVPFFVALRSFSLVRQMHNTRLLILAISMAMISLTAIAGFVGDNVTIISLNVDWFNYIGQAVCFLFIWLSLLNGGMEYQRTLLRWQLVLCVPLLLLFAFATILPADFPDPAVTKTILSGSRGLICACIFYYYVGAFMKKETRFSLLMSVSFLLLSLGIFVILPKYGSSAGLLNTDLFDHLGDSIRICGLIALLIAVIGG